MCGAEVPQPEVVLALAKMVHDVHEKQNVPNPL